MAAYHAEYLTDLAKPSRVIQIPHQFAMGDNESHTFSVLVYDSDNPSCGLMAGTVSGIVVRPDGGSVILTGEKGEAAETVNLPDGTTAQATRCTITTLQACFAYAGQITVVIRLVDDETITAVFMGRGPVVPSLTDTPVDPGELIEDITTLIATANQAAEDAEDALEQASAIVSYAEQTGQTDAQKLQARTNIGAGSAADVADLKSAINIVSAGWFDVRQGYYGVADGNYATLGTWCCSVGYVPKNIRVSFPIDTIGVILQAFQQDGTYVGSWQSGSWVTSYNYRRLAYPAINIRRVAALYPKYNFKLTFAKDGAAESLTPSEVTSSMMIDDPLETEHDFIFNVIGETVDNFKISGSSVGSKGNIRKSSGGNYITDFIPVFPGMKLCVYAACGGDATTLFAYNSGHGPMDNLIWHTSAAGRRYTEGTIVTIPANVAFVRGCFDMVLCDRTLNTITTNREGYEYIQKFNAVPENAVKIFTGEYAVGEIRENCDTSSGIVDSTTTLANYRLSSNGLVTLPAGKYSKLLVRMKNSNYYAKIYLGEFIDHMEAVTSPKTWYKDGDILDISGYTTTYTTTPLFIGYTLGFPIYYANPGSDSDTNKALTTDDYALAGIEIYALYDDTRIIESDNVRQIASAKVDMYPYTGVSTRRYRDDQAAVLVHASDPHGDEHRIRRMFDLADQIQADAVLVTGDIVCSNILSGIGWFHDIVKTHTSQAVICLGNHDPIYTASDADAYAKILDPIKTELGLTAEKTYYSIDIAAKKLRIISLNLYQSGGSSQAKTHFNTDQISWLITTLSGTPAGYGIIILEHAAQRPIRLENPENKTFFEPGKDRLVYTQGTITDVTGAPIYDLIDAFIGRTTINQTYAQTGSPSSITVEADFSEVDKTVEFIGFASGHLHEDTICPIPDTTHMQLALNVTTSNPYYGGVRNPYLNESSDLPRSSVGESQDAFNVYVIHRDRKLIKVVRVGADYTIDQAWRKYAEVDYTAWTHSTPTLTSGSIYNPSNDHAVTSDYVPVSYGQVVHTVITRPTDGYYTYGFAVYDSSKTLLYYVDFDGATKYPYETISNANAAYVRCLVGQYTFKYAGLALAASDFSSGQFTVDVSE